MMKWACKSSNCHFASTVEDLGSLHVLLQLFCQPARLRFHGKQLQKGLQARLPRHFSLAHQRQSQGGKHGHRGRRRDGSTGTQRGCRDALSFNWLLKGTLGTFDIVYSFFIYSLFWRWEQPAHCVIKSQKWSEDRLPWHNTHTHRERGHLLLRSHNKDKPVRGLLWPSRAPEIQLSCYIFLSGLLPSIGVFKAPGW